MYINTPSKKKALFKMECQRLHSLVGAHQAFDVPDEIYWRVWHVCEETFDDGQFNESLELDGRVTDSLLEFAAVADFLVD